MLCVVPMLLFLQLLRLTLILHIPLFMLLSLIVVRMLPFLTMHSYTLSW